MLNLEQQARLVGGLREKFVEIRAHRVKRATLTFHPPYTDRPAVQYFNVKDLYMQIHKQTNKRNNKPALWDRVMRFYL
jgi:hypothetical protein